MHKLEFENCGRSMRWYEWIAGLLLLGLCAGVRAETAYKCAAADGAVVYQATPCTERQSQHVIAIAAPPPYAPSPHYAAERKHDEPTARASFVSRKPTPAQTAYECRASDGRIFYRLETCPRSIGAEATSGGSQSHHGKRGAHGSGGTVTVASRRVTREQACREIHRAGAIGRNGHEFDESVSTYEHDLGNDPCK